MTVIEHVFERRFGEKVRTDDMQFGFRPDRGATDSVFNVWW